MGIAKSYCICIAVLQAYSVLLMHFLENVEFLFCPSLLVLTALCYRFQPTAGVRRQTGKSSQLGGMKIVLENASE